MRSRRISTAAATAALAAMLFAQAALALASCDLGRSAASPMHAAAAHEAQAAPCHEPVDSANLCIAHCRNNDQSLDKPQVKAPVLPLAPALPGHFAHAPCYERVAWTRMAALPAGPPPRILFQSFLI